MYSKWQEAIFFIARLRLMMKRRMKKKKHRHKHVFHSSHKVSPPSLSQQGFVDKCQVGLESHLTTEPQYSSPGMPRINYCSCFPEQH